jgi:hypothetical protein
MVHKFCILCQLLTARAKSCSINDTACIFLHSKAVEEAIQKMFLNVVLMIDLKNRGSKIFPFKWFLQNIDEESF